MNHLLGLGGVMGGGPLVYAAHDLHDHQLQIHHQQGQAMTYMQQSSAYHPQMMHQGRHATCSGSGFTYSPHLSCSGHAIYSHASLNARLPLGPVYQPEQAVPFKKTSIVDQHGEAMKYVPLPPPLPVAYSAPVPVSFPAAVASPTPMPTAIPVKPKFTLILKLIYGLILDVIANLISNAI